MRIRFWWGIKWRKSGKPDVGLEIEIWKSEAKEEVQMRMERQVDTEIGRRGRAKIEILAMRYSGGRGRCQ